MLLGFIIAPTTRNCLDYLSKTHHIMKSKSVLITDWIYSEFSLDSIQVYYSQKCVSLQGVLYFWVFFSLWNQNTVIYLDLVRFIFRDTKFSPCVCYLRLRVKDVCVLQHEQRCGLGNEELRVVYVQEMRKGQTRPRLWSLQSASCLAVGNAGCVCLRQRKDTKAELYWWYLA